MSHSLYYDSKPDASIDFYFLMTLEDADILMMVMGELYQNGLPGIWNYH